MELNKTLVAVILCIFVIPVMTSAVTQKVYVNTLYINASLINATNISILSTFTDGILFIAGGKVTNAYVINSTNMTGSYLNFSSIYEGPFRVLTSNNYTAIISYIDSQITSVNNGISSNISVVNQNINNNVSAITGYISTNISSVHDNILTNASALNVRINSVNTSSNLEGLGFNTTSNLTVYFNSLFQPVGSYINLSFLNANYYNNSQINSFISGNISSANFTNKSYVDAQDIIINTSAVIWDRLYQYPSPCPADTYITDIKDTVTCTGISDFYAFDNGDNLTGNYNFTGNISQDTNFYHCFGPFCNASIKYNGSSLIIKVN